MYNDSDGANKPTTTTNNGDSQDSHIYPSDGISRFLADSGQRLPVGFGPAQTQSEAQAVGEARMLASLRAFDAQFSCDKSVEAKSTQ